MDYTKKPIEDVIAAAQNGDVEAQKALGLLHELGLVPGASAQQAVDWYKQAAQAGDGLSALSLQAIFEKGSPGVPANSHHAKTYSKMAESAGFRPADVRLAEAGILRKRTVLVVDDSPITRRTTLKLLSDSGYEVYEAEDAQTAIRILKRRPHIDLVLSDVEMPHVDGIEFLSFIRKNLRRTNLPVVMVTSNRQIEVLKRAKILGVQGWILKPFEAVTLLQTIRKALVA
jgi:two-component system chemotaxis response regulator CheY